jgi:hypothetical protein
MVIKRIKQFDVFSRFLTSKHRISVVVKGDDKKLTSAAEITLEAPSVEKIDDDTFEVVENDECTLNITHPEYEPHIQTFTATDEMRIQVTLNKKPEREDNNKTTINTPVVDPSIRQVRQYTDDDNLVNAIQEYTDCLTYLFDDSLVITPRDPEVEYVVVYFKEEVDVDEFDTDVKYQYILAGEKSITPFRNAMDDTESFFVISEKFISPTQAIANMKKDTYSV